MSYWSHNPELLDEIIFAELERRGKVNIEEGMREELDRVQKEDPKLFDDALLSGEREYWADKIDAAKDRVNEQKMKREDKV